MAATNKLTDTKIAAIKAARAGKAKMVADCGGLVLEVQPSGAGWWRLRST